MDRTDLMIVSVQRDDMLDGLLPTQVATHGQYVEKIPHINKRRVIYGSGRLE